VGASREQVKNRKVGKKLEEEGVQKVEQLHPCWGSFTSKYKLAQLSLVNIKPGFME
jgi:hypothetical protein